MDSWWRKLSPPGKLIWIYLCDNCDAIGLCDFDRDLVAADIGLKVTPAWHGEFGDRIQVLKSGKVFLTKFIDFQYGELSEACAPHRRIIKMVSDRGLTRTTLGYQYPSATLELPLAKGTGTLKDNNGKEEERKGSGEVVGGEPNPEAVAIPIPPLTNRARGTIDDVKLLCASLGLPVTDAEWFFHKCEANGWTNAGKPIKDWQATVRSWKAGGYMPSQKSQPQPVRKRLAYQP